jgi:malonyl-CoA/methylmalonyl-CoA synthetase
MSTRGEASGIALAEEILGRFEALDRSAQIAFYRDLAHRFDPDPAAITRAAAAYATEGSSEALAELMNVAEPPRQELFRRLNQAPNGAQTPVSMRNDLLSATAQDPSLQRIDNDLLHLLSSWFNRGFLVMEPITWSSAADILEKIIDYEAVHEIGDWTELRRRLEPPDRRCFAFFHPAMPGEPLVFVEVALTRDTPDSIEGLLDGDREILGHDETDTAVFYSISNCQSGLRGVSFGSFLTKQVVADLTRELPALETFVTLSPAPGFAGWLAQQRSDGDQLAGELLDLGAMTLDDGSAESLGHARLATELGAHYFLYAKRADGRPIDPERHTVTNHLLDGLFGHHDGDGEAVLLRLADGSTRSRADVHDLAARLGVALVDHGIEPGDRVVVQVDKSPEALALYVACVRTGAVLVPLNTAYTATEIEYFIDDAEPGLVVCSSNREGELRQRLEAAGTNVATTTLDSDGSGRLIDDAAGATAGSVADREPDDLAAILYTSDTTGRSKGAMLTHNNLLTNAQALVELWQFGDTDVLLHALPMFHTHGLFLAGNGTFLAGGSMIFLPSFDADEIVGLLPQATAMMGVPTFYRRLLARDDFTAELVAHIRLFVSGSAPLRAETHVEFEERTGKRVLERYGMTETNMIASNPYDGERRAGTVGFGLPGVEVRVRPPGSAEDAAVGDVGVIEVQGPNVFPGYWRMPEKTAEEFTDDGFFVTGDLGTFDDDGYLQIVGRDKDLIISGGFNVYPKEIETALDGVAESAVWGCRTRTSARRGGRGGRRRRRPPRRGCPPHRPGRPVGPLQAAEEGALRGRAPTQRHGQGPEEGTARYPRGAARRNTMTHPLCRSTARRMVDLLGAGEVTPHDALDAIEERVREVEAAVNALPITCFDRARAHADRLNRTNPQERGVLKGLPVPIKDLTAVDGVRTTMGSLLDEHTVTDYSDLLVEHLEDNGGVVYAKSNTPEFGAGGNTFNEVFGPTRSPPHRRRILRWSSSGTGQRHSLARPRIRSRRLAAHAGQLLRRHQPPSLA